MGAAQKRLLFVNGTMGAGKSATCAALLKQMQPAVAGIKDTKQRNAVADALIKCVTAKDSASDIGKLLQISQNAAKTRAADSKSMDLDAIQAAYDQCNPHKTKKEV